MGGIYLFRTKSREVLATTERVEDNPPFLMALLSHAVPFRKAPASTAIALVRLGAYGQPWTFVVIDMLT